MKEYTLKLEVKGYFKTQRILRKITAITQEENLTMAFRCPGNETYEKAGSKLEITTSKTRPFMANPITIKLYYKEESNEESLIQKIQKL